MFRSTVNTASYSKFIRSVQKCSIVFLEALVLTTLQLEILRHYLINDNWFSLFVALVLLFFKPVFVFGILRMDFPETKTLLYPYVLCSLGSFSIS